jgi:beta-phosphoglucomutase
MIKAIIFDAEGIVVDTESIWDKEQTLFLSRRGVVYQPDKVKYLVSGRSLKMSTEILFEIYGFQEKLEDAVNERKTTFQKFLEDEIEFICGFKDFFFKVKPYYKVCIATSLDVDNLTIIDKKLNLSSFFKENLFSINDVGQQSKPDPAIFLYAARKLKVEQSNCLVIEDSPSGIEAAKKAGMRCIALSTTYPRHRLTKADFIYSRYEQIPIDQLSHF